MKKTLVTIAIALISQATMLVSASAGEHLLQPKVGLVDWSKNGTHTVKGNGFNLDSDVSPSSGFMYLYRLDNGFSFGGEIYQYKKDYTHTNGNTGDVKIGHIYGLAEYYFNNDGSVKPFVGIGLGGVGMDFSGEIDHNTSGPSAQIKAGVEFTVNKRFAISAEAKYFHLKLDEEINGQKADIKSNGYATFVGFTIKI